MNEKTAPREILFRGKRTDSGEWAYGYFIYARTDNSAGICTEKDGCIDVDPATVGQYTGLTDENGVKVFEGDIVAFEDAVNDVEGYHDNIYMNRGVVSIYPSGVSFSNREVVDMDDLHNTDDSVEAEVIGNVHDNPELLSDKEETGE